jgi:hypothetical protein
MLNLLLPSRLTRDDYIESSLEDINDNTEA